MKEHKIFRYVRNPLVEISPWWLEAALLLSARRVKCIYVYIQEHAGRAARKRETELYTRTRASRFKSRRRDKAECDCSHIHTHLIYIHLPAAGTFPRLTSALAPFTAVVDTIVHIHTTRGTCGKADVLFPRLGKCPLCGTRGLCAHAEASVGTFVPV